MSAFVHILLTNWRQVQYYMINLLEHNCSIFTIIRTLKVISIIMISIIIIGINKIADNLN